jgi:hypothetical protein
MSNPAAQHNLSASDDQQWASLFTKTTALAFPENAENASLSEHVGLKSRSRNDCSRKPCCDEP